MRWFKVAAIGVGILIAFLTIGWVIGAILHAVIDLVIAAAVVGAIVAAVKVARSRKQVSGAKADREVREPGYEEYRRPLPRADVVPTRDVPGRASRPARDVPVRDVPVRDVPAQAAPGYDVEDDLARLKREMGNLA